MSKKTQHGFTMIELMIATAVFSMLLVAITVAVIYFTRSYYKGVIASNTQDSARSIVDKLTQAVQLGTGKIDVSGQSGSTSQKYVCAGGYVFVYELGTQYMSASDTGIYRAKQIGDCRVPATPTDKQQLLSPRMRLNNLTIDEGSNGMYGISATVSYGDADLLCVYGDAANCAESHVTTDAELVSADIACKPTNGAEYCAVSKIVTTAQKRVGQ